MARGHWQLALLVALIFAAAAFLSMGYFLPHEASDLTLRIIFLVSLLYAPRDIVSDTVFAGPRSDALVSDAAAIAMRYGLTETLVGLIWVALFVGVIYITARATLRQPSNIVFKKTAKTR